MNTKDIIKKCFTEAKVPLDDRHKYLFQLLADETYKAFEKGKAKEFENSICDLLCNGYTLEYANGCSICAGPNSIQYNGDKDFVVENPYKNPVGFNTIVAAMKHIEKIA